MNSTDDSGSESFPSRRSRGPSHENKALNGLSNVTIGDFELFCVVIDQGGFREAARYLGLSQSGVSRRIAGIEKLLNTTLLERTTRSMKLTEAGRRFLGEARQFAAYSQFLGSITGNALAPIALNLQSLLRRATALSIVHRETELAAIASWFASLETRLLTIVGTGGVGKTALMRLVQLELNAAQPNRALWLDLAHITSLRGALLAICGKLQIPLAGQDVVSALIEHLQRQGRVLALDNVEQITGLGKTLVEIIEQCPALRVIATTRNALEVRLEQVVPIEPLVLPALDCETIEVAAMAPAFQLFMRRLGGNGGNIETLVNSRRSFLGWLSMLRRTDGLPLAIELVASHMKYLPPAEALSLTLDHRVLGRQSATSTSEVATDGDRHDSLYACFRSSWFALGSRSQRYLTCLSLLKERFDIEVALELGQAIAIESPQAEFERLLRAYLVERLVASEDQYRVLVPIREFVGLVSRQSAGENAKDLAHLDIGSTVDREPPQKSDAITVSSTTIPSLYDEVFRRACGWAWAMCQRINHLREKPDTNHAGAMLQGRFAGAMYDIVELDGAAQYLSVVQQIQIRIRCFAIQGHLGLPVAKHNIQIALSLLSDSLEPHLRADVLYCLARIEAQEGDKLRARETFERAHALGADRHQQVAVRRMLARNAIYFSLNDEPLHAMTAFKQSLVEAARTRLASYAHHKALYAYVLLAYGNDPKTALKHLRHLTNANHWLQRQTGILPRNLLRLRIASFMTAPTDAHWRALQTDLRSFVMDHMNVHAYNGDEYTVALAELIGFVSGSPPLHAELWLGSASPTLRPESRTNPERWVVLLTSACMHLQNGNHAVARNFYAEALRAHDTLPAHPSTPLRKALSLIGERLNALSNKRT
ncbi:MAG: LysR family transcriptional regulator [Casimicrobium sp.]